MADLDTIMSERPADSQDEQTQPRDDGRDEKGRFASQQPEPEAPQPEVPVQQQEQQPAVNPLDGYVPIQTLDARLAKQEEKLRREFAAEMQQRLAQLQPPTPVEPARQPDYFENPDAAVDFRLQQAIGPVQQGQQQIVERFSKALAIKDYGKEAVDAAYAEMVARVNADPQGTVFDYQRIMSSDLPYDALVKWHKAQSVLSKFSDPAAIEAEIEKRIAERGQQSQTQPGNPQVDPATLPTSFAGARNAGPSSAPAWTGPRPLSEIMNGR